MIEKFPRKLDVNEYHSNYALVVNINILVDKINEIIDVINKENKR